MSAALFPTIGPAQERGYLAAARQRRREHVGFFARAYARRLAQLGARPVTTAEALAAAQADAPTFTTGGSLAAEKDRGDRRSQGQEPHAHAAGGG